MLTLQKVFSPYCLGIDLQKKGSVMMKNNHKFVMIMFTVLLVILAACGNSSEDSNAILNNELTDSHATQNTNGNSSEHEDTQNASNIKPETGTDSADGTNFEQEVKKHNNSTGEQSQEEPLEEYVPNEDEIVLNNNHLKNKDILEAFMKVAGENGESEIRVVKNEGVKGVLIYDLKSRYDKDAKQGWIEVFPDLSHYRASNNEVQDVFNNARQQCGYISKDETEGYYKLNECRTHWEYRLLPIINEDG